MVLQQCIYKFACHQPASLKSPPHMEGSGGLGSTELGWVTPGSLLDWSGCSSQGNIKQGRSLKSESPQGRVHAARGEGHELRYFHNPPTSSSPLLMLRPSIEYLFLLAFLTPVTLVSPPRSLAPSPSLMACFQHFYYQLFSSILPLLRASGSTWESRIACEVHTQKKEKKKQGWCCVRYLICLHKTFLRRLTSLYGEPKAVFFFPLPFLEMVTCR